MQAKHWTSLALAASIVIGITAASEATAETAYAWANQPTANSYAPNSLYALNSQGNVQIQRQGTGRYRVVFKGLGSSQPDKPGNGGHVQVSAYQTADRCSIGSWNFKGPDFNVDVTCFKGGTANTPVDAQFTVMVTAVVGPIIMRVEVSNVELGALQRADRELSRRILRLEQQ